MPKYSNKSWFASLCVCMCVFTNQLNYVYSVIFISPVQVHIIDYDYHSKAHNLVKIQSMQLAR